MERKGKTYTLPLVVVGDDRRVCLPAEEDLNVRVDETGVQLVRARLVKSPVRHLSQRPALRQLDRNPTPRQAILFNNVHQEPHDPGCHRLARRLKARILDINPHVSRRWCHKTQLRTQLERKHVLIWVLLHMTVLPWETDMI